MVAIISKHFIAKARTETKLAYAESNFKVAELRYAQESCASCKHAIGAAFMLKCQLKNKFIKSGNICASHIKRKEVK